MNTIEVLDFLAKFSALYQKYYGMMLVMGTGHQAVSIALTHPKQTCFLTIDRIRMEAWVASFNPAMLADIHAKPEIMRLCHDLVPMEKASVIPEPDAKNKFAITRLIEILRRICRRRTSSDTTPIIRMASPMSTSV